MGHHDPPRRFTIGSKTTREKQYDEDDKDNADDANAAMTIAIAIAAKSSAKSAKQENDQEDDENEANRHDLSPEWVVNGTEAIKIKTPDLSIIDGSAPARDSQTT